jgi:hypothetical protein
MKVLQMSEKLETLVAVFRDSDALVKAAKALVAQGNEEFEALSPMPVEGLDDVLPHRPSSVRWFTLLGCIAGAVLGMAFQIMTVVLWPIWVGGKPIISLPAFVIVSFEVTILVGAIATMAGLMMNAKLPLIGRDYYHQGCSQSDFAIVVKTNPDERAAVESSLREAGATEIKPVEPQSVLLGIEDE